MTTQYDDPLYRDPELAQFYDMDNEWRAVQAGFTGNGI